jgi:gamma-glutamylcyclotransferase (GGCT)/AIG2-like uncharacterized protein YtfP
MGEQTHAPEFFETGRESGTLSPRRGAALDCTLLFVYGTLRRGFRLHRHLVTLGARFESKAKVAGELFNLGSYPGAKPIGAENSWVVGEVFHLRNVDADFKVLDNVEGFIPESPERSEFIRSQARLILSNGDPQTAWVYWLMDDNPGSLQRIPSGDYADHLTKKRSILRNE